MPTLIRVLDSEHCLPFALDDRIFLGEGLFETLKISHGNPCYPKAHWQRLKAGALYLGLTFDLSFERWQDTLYDCIESKQLKEGGIKAILSGGSAARGLASRGRESHLLLTAFSYLRKTHPLKLMHSNWKRDAKNPIYQIKSINYLESIVAIRQAQAQGFDDVLFFNSEEQLTETTIANVFIIQSNQLFTPNLESGALAGVLRERVLSLAAKHHLNCFECKLSKEDLKQAEAVFTTNVLQGLRPVGSINEQLFDSHHPIIKLMQNLLEKEAALNYSARVDDNN